MTIDHIIAGRVLPGALGRVSPIALAVLVAFCSEFRDRIAHRPQRRYVTLSQRRLADAVCMSRGAVRNALRELELRRLIRVRHPRKKGLPHIYIRHLDSAPEDRTWVSSEVGLGEPTSGLPQAHNKGGLSDCPPAGMVRSRKKLTKKGRRDITMPAGAKRPVYQPYPDEPPVEEDPEYENGLRRLARELGVPFNGGRS